MTIKIFVSEVDGVDEDSGDLVFRVKALDEGVVEVELKSKIHDENSWPSVAVGVTAAIKLMSKDLPCPAS